METLISRDVRCGKLPHFRGEGILHPDGTRSKKWPIIEGYHNVNVCSNGTTYKVLSPMLIGPFEVIEEKVVMEDYPKGIHPGFEECGEYQCATAMNLENYWQGSKIFNVDVVNGEIEKTFFERRAKMMADPKPHRRALPKKVAYPVASYFNGQILTYVAARIYYITYYERLVRKKKEYQQLKERVSLAGIQILGFDGRDPLSGKDYGENPITYEILEREMYNPKLPFGHELVLCGMLLGMRPWKKFDMERAMKVDGALN